VNVEILAPAFYRFRATFARRRAGYLALVLLIGLIGGVAMAAVAGARRTQSSFPVYLASTNPSDVSVFTEFDPISQVGYSPSIASAIAKVRYVRHSADVIGFDGTLQVLGGIPWGGASGKAPPAVEGSLNGGYLTQDRVNVIRGRMTNPARLDEFVMSQGGADQLGLHVGSTLPLVFFTDAQVNSPTFAGYPIDKPYLSIKLKLVGIVESSNQIVQDDDAALGDQFAVLTPTLTRRLATCCAYYSYTGLQFSSGARNERAVLSSVRKLLPNLGPAGGAQTQNPFVAKAERAIRPEAIAFGVFGLIAAVASLLICGQAISRLLRRGGEDALVLRALGAGPVTTAADALVGILAGVVVGSLLAVAIAIGLSPLSPVGAVRPVYPHPGISLDWTVLGLGLALLVLVLASTAILMAFRLSPHRTNQRGRGAARPSSVSGAAAAIGLPPATFIGIRSALSADARRGTVPMRSAVFGAILAVIVLVTSITFGASLNALVSRPPLYGWNWNYALLSGFSGQEDLPEAETASLLNHDRAVAHWASAYLLEIDVDGQPVPTLVMRPHAPVGPPILSGHSLLTDGQIVLGAATLAQLHKHVGDTVVVGGGDLSPTRLRVVGTATLPTIKGAGGSLQMGTGAVVSPVLYTASDLNVQGSAIPGPNAELIVIRRGVSAEEAQRSLDRIVQVLNQPSDPDGPVGGVVSLLRPAEIANYRAVGSTPAVLASVLAVGAVGALGLTLAASVRQRRREFALLKAFGFTRRQLASTIAWQSSVSAVVGVIVGVPVGIALGRWLWTLFARQISAVQYPTVPVGSVLFVAFGALLFANVAAALPGRSAARTSTTAPLQAE